MPDGPKRRKRHWRTVDARRRTSTDRGYDNHWREASEQYRRINPFCVLCELKGVTSDSECVDHIIPIHCCPELRMDADNWAALCWGCHSHKTTQEPRRQWTPNVERLVICGVDAASNREEAEAIGWPTLDLDAMGKGGTQEIVEAAAAWAIGQRGPFVAIVASTITASVLAARLGGCVKHLTR